MSRVYLGILSGNDLVGQKAAYDKLFSEPPPWIACDIETNSTKDTTVIGVGFVTPDHHGFFFDINDPSLPWHLLLPSRTKKVWQNGPFDLERQALGKFGADIDNIEDTAIGSRLLHLPVDLESASRRTGRWTTRSVPSYLAEYKVKQFKQLPWEAIASKCINDCHVTAEVYILDGAVYKTDYYQELMKMQSLLLHMSHRGMRLDNDRVQAIDTELERDIALYYGTAKDIGFNPNSHTEVAYTLMDAGVWLPFKRDKSNVVEVTAQVLENINHPYAQLTLVAKRTNKLHGTYVHKYLNKGRAYSRFGMAAATGRVTSANENLHNIPTGRRPGDIVPKAGSIRTMFLPDGDWMTRFDLSQIELRVAAHLSGDQAMYDALNDPTRTKENDIHGTIAHRAGVVREVAKNIVFGGMMYGGSAQEVARTIRFNNVPLIERIQHEWIETYPVYHAWSLAQEQIGLRTMQVESLYGRKLFLDATKRELTEKHIRNSSIAWPVQCTAFEIFMKILLRLTGVVNIEDFILNIHDEQMLEGRLVLPWDEILADFPFPVKVEVDYRTRWAGGKIEKVIV